MYIDERPKSIGNIVGFINGTKPGSTIKQHNRIFEGCDESHVFLCAIKSIDVGEYLFICYNLTQVVTNMVTMGVVHLTIYPTFNYWIQYLMYVLVLYCSNFIKIFYI